MKRLYIAPHVIFINNFSQMKNKTQNLLSFLLFPMLIIATSASSYGQNNANGNSMEPDMPAFAHKFPPKTVRVNDSVELTFSSIEEAEWKLLHRVPYEAFYDAFVEVLQSDPSSMDYPFDSLTYFDPSRCAPMLTSVVWSEDRNMRCIGLTYYTPSLLVQYRADGEVRLAEDKLDDNSYWCQCPDTVYTLPTDHSTLYLVRGFDGSTGGERSYCLQAYELDETGFHPAFVFEEINTPNSNGTKQNIYMTICDNEEMTNTVFNDGISSLVYFDGKERTVYVRVFKEKEPGADGCTFKMTNRYRKYVWDCLSLYRSSLSLFILHSLRLHI